MYIYIYTRYEYTDLQQFQQIIEMYIWLVVSKISIFHNIWDVILPIDFHIFQDGYCTTNQIFTCLFGYLQCRPTILTKNRNVDLLLIDDFPSYKAPIINRC